jgi:cytoskeletal protein CcmA (bactofilin family)
MPLFRRDPTPVSTPGASLAQPAGTPTRSYLAPGSLIEGELGGAVAVLIEGEVRGGVRVDSEVMVGTRGVVNGPLIARIVRIAGKVAGNVEASELVNVEATGSVEGDIAAPRVIIAEGAFFRGQVEMRNGAGKGERGGKQRAKGGGAPGERRSE